MTEAPTTPAEPEHVELASEQKFDHEAMKAIAERARADAEASQLDS